MTGSITLDDVAARADVLVVACSRCDRAGRYSVDTLIIYHGRRFGIPSLLTKLSADCPKRQSISVYDLCGVHAPELSKQKTSSQGTRYMQGRLGGVKLVILPNGGTNASAETDPRFFHPSRNPIRL